MTSCRNMLQFLSEVNHNMSSLRKYFLRVNNVTLEMLLSGLVYDIDIPKKDDILNAVYTVGKNTNNRGELVWVLNNKVVIYKTG